jgi:dTDP-4-dehydrorhamnose reductase
LTRFLVTGASGLLGLNFGLYTCQQHDVVGVVNHNALLNAPFAVHQLELSQPGAARKLIETTRPQVILHCAAMANVDACESQPQLAQRVNADLPGELAALAAEFNCKMVHISTDAVFNGENGNYCEEDATAPLSVYARTKLAGEEAVLAANPRAIVARVNFYGWSITGRRSLAEFFYSHLSAGEKMKGFTDVHFCPLEVHDLSDLLLEMAAKDLQGIYHVVSSESLSKFEFGQRLARQFGLDASLIQPVSWRDAGLQAARSPELTLNTEKLRNALQHSLPDQAHGMARFAQSLSDGLPDVIRKMITQPQMDTDGHR